MREFFELFRKENERGFMKLEISQSYREDWNIIIKHSTNDKIIFEVKEGIMDLAFAKAYTQLLEHVYKN
jgi:hypothetical protein